MPTDAVGEVCELDLPDELAIVTLERESESSVGITIRPRVAQTCGPEELWPSAMKVLAAWYTKAADEANKALEREEATQKQIGQLLTDLHAAHPVAHAIALEVFRRLPSQVETRPVELEPCEWCQCVNCACVPEGD